MRATTGLWRDVEDGPEALARTLEAADGVAETAALLRADGVRRVVATGNGAAYYVAHALWLASLESAAGGPELIAVPGGMVARGAFPWREGDILLAISSSGEFRDVVEAIAAGAPRPLAAITAVAGSTIGSAATARALQHVVSERAVTHTQALAGGVALALAIWADVVDDASLRTALADAPATLTRAIAAANAFSASELTDLQTPTAATAFGSGPAWSGALETALLVKEVARVPAEGTETREGATTAMYALGPGQLVLALEIRDDPSLDEAVRICAETGARTLRLPGGELGDRRLAPITTLPAAVAVAIALAQVAGHDVDHPGWVEAYYRTARAT